MSDKPATTRPDSTDSTPAEPGTDGDRSPSAAVPDADSRPGVEANEAPREIGGRDGPDPTRYGDWEKNGRCIDF